jgi:hypothetical protein
MPITSIRALKLNKAGLPGSYPEAAPEEAPAVAGHLDYGNSQLYDKAERVERVSLRAA